MITIGDHTYFAQGSNLIKEYHDPIVEVGKFTSIAGGVRFMGTAQHASVINRQFVSNYPFAERWGVSYPIGQMRGPIRIGNDVWIGEDAMIMDGVTIGDGAIVGANTMVVKDVPPYAVVVGNPGIIKHYRFSQDVIDRLLDIKWWEWTEDIITERLEDFKDIEKFVAKYSGQK